MKPKSPKITPLSLQECSDLLQKEVPSAPALVTLKRWSAGGILDGAKMYPDGATRPKYNYEVVLKIVKKHISINAPTAPTAKKGVVQIQDSSAPAVSLSVSTGDDVTPTQSLAQMVPPTPVAAPLFNEGALVEAIKELINAELRPILSDAIAQSQKQMIDGLTNLDSIRKILMVKYDAEIHSLRTRLNEVLAENERLKESSSGLNAERINAHLGRISMKLDSISNARNGDHRYE